MPSDPPGRPRGRPKSVDREHAIRAAMEGYWRDGLHTRSLNALCRHVGLSKPSLYREFGGEDGLMAAAVGLYRELVVVPLVTALASDMPFGTLLQACVAGMTTDRGTPPGCLFTTMRLAPSRLGEQAARAVHSMVEERHAAFEDAYRRAVERGEANSRFTPSFAAGYLDAQFTTVLLQMGAGEPSDRVAANAHVAFEPLLHVP